MISARQKLHHLYSRAAFGMQADLYFNRLSLQQHIDLQFESSKRILPFSTKKNELTRKMSKEDKTKLRQESKWQAKRWFDRMVAAKETALVEKMSLFWHGHLPCRIILGNTISANYINAIRNNALGNYRDLLMDVSKSAAMIRYLNNQQNKKSSPNENFAREVLELFTIGKGGYTESDIKEAARAFTGWSSNLKGEFVFRKAFHDEGEKTFMGNSGHLTGEDIIDITLAQPQTARTIVRKVYSFFVSDTIDESRVEVLGRQFYNSNYDIALLMRSIFESDWFYEEEFIKQQIKSPIQLLVNFCQITNAEIKGIIPFMKYSSKLGQKLLDPPNVAGWPGGKSWINNASLALRMNLGMMLVNPRKNKQINIDTNTQLLSETLKQNSDRSMRDLSIMFLGVDVSEKLGLEDGDIDQAIAKIASQMEFQLC
jgi:uncharacterized protein (DUF1800 family)